jgi:hypothetical protein
MRCARCEFHLATAGRPCPNCGYLPLLPAPAPSYKVCPKCSQPAVAAMAACGRCGYLYPGFAPPGQPTSAAPVRPSVHQREFVSPASSQRKMIRGLLVCLCLLLAIALAAGLNSVMGMTGGNSLGEGLVVVPQKRSSGYKDLTGSSIDSGQFASRLAQSNATLGGELEISLAWNSTSDLDIEVRAPSGEQVHAYNWKAQCGGVQDVDANPTPLTPAGATRYQSGMPPGAESVIQLPEFMFQMDQQFGGLGSFGGLEGLLGGNGGKPPSRYTRTPIEHIHFEQAPKGIYTVYASCFSWREPGKMPLPFTVQVRSHGKVVQTITDTIGPSSYCADGTGSMEVCRLEVR